MTYETHAYNTCIIHTQVWRKHKFHGGRIFHWVGNICDIPGGGYTTEKTDK